MQNYFAKVQNMHWNSKNYIQFDLYNTSLCKLNKNINFIMIFFILA